MERTYYITLRYFEFQEYFTEGSDIAKFWKYYSPYAYVAGSNTYIDLEYKYLPSKSGITDLLYIKYRPMKGDTPAGEWGVSDPFNPGTEFDDWWRSHTKDMEDEIDAGDGGDFTDDEQ